MTSEAENVDDDFVKSIIVEELENVPETNKNGNEPSTSYIKPI